MPKTPSTTSPVTPPPAAVAQDAHWAAKLARLRARTRPTTTLTICDDDAVREALEAAKRRVDHAQVLGDDTEQQTAADDLATAQATFDDAAIVLTFQALPRPDFDALKLAHPPTESQAEDGQIVNVETLGPELIAAASTDGLTPDDARAFLTEWAAGEAAQLFLAVWDLQTDVRSDLGKG
ncbi:hypothetical protein ACFWV1_25935 [Streptomyces sp. NPDC058700]|uniref:hypothetical protein n=1 Tax=Streptomyces sp. NPDC058700 TaxID=3346607 RepID=UPI003662F2A1